MVQVIYNALIMARPEDQPGPLREVQDILSGKDVERHCQVPFQIPFSVAMRLAIFLRVEQMRPAYRVMDLADNGDVTEPDNIDRIVFPESEQLWWVAADKFPELPTENEKAVSEARRKIKGNEPYAMQLSGAEVEAVGQKIIADIHLEDEMTFFDSWHPIGLPYNDDIREVIEDQKEAAKELIGAFQQTYRAFIQAGGQGNPELMRRIVATKRHRHLVRG